MAESESEFTYLHLSESLKPIAVGDLEDYLIKSKVGEGPVSTVWRAEQKSNGREVALKQIPLSKLSPQLRDCLRCEINFLSSVNHPNIIHLLNVFQLSWENLKPLDAEVSDKTGVYCFWTFAMQKTEADGCIFLVLEFCHEGDLGSYIRTRGSVQEHIVRRFMKHIGAALRILHAHNIIHRDLKPENILLSGPEDSPVLKIADFGLSRMVNPGNFAETVCGSPLYMAPEILQFQRYNEKVDMWSVGAILFELLHGYPPFHGRNNFQVLQKINSCKCLPFSQLLLPQLDPDCVDMCSRLLCTDPVNRLSFQEFYLHMFLRKSKRIVKDASSNSSALLSFS